MGLGIRTTDADWIITEIDDHLWGTEMAASKSKTTFNSVNLSLSVIEIGIDLVSEPIYPFSDCSEKPVSKRNAKRPL